MKPLLLLFVFLTTVSFSQSVKEKRGYSRFFNDTVPTSDSVLTYIALYYPDGKLIQTTEYDFQDGKIGDTTTTYYDTLQHINTTIGKMSMSVSYFDSLGNLIKIERTYRGSVSTYTFQQQKSGLHWENVTYENGKEVERSKSRKKRSKEMMGDAVHITKYYRNHHLKKIISRGEVIKNKNRRMKAVTCYRKNSNEIKRYVQKAYHRRVIVIHSTFKHDLIVETIKRNLTHNTSTQTSYYYTYY